jgi:hypothetical protein
MEEFHGKENAIELCAYERASLYNVLTISSSRIAFRSFQSGIKAVKNS